MSCMSGNLKVAITAKIDYQKRKKIFMACEIHVSQVTQVRYTY